VGFTVAGLTLGHIRVLATIAESTCKCLVLGHGFFQLFAHIFMAWNTERSLGCHGIVNLQRMMCWMATQAITGYLPLCMGLMTLGTIWNLTMYLMAECT
jgi:hypothetical protein